MQKAYAYKNSYENLMIASSGGAFLGIVEAFFCEHSDGIVFGCMFDDQLNVKHAYAEKYEDCKKFCGSKYVRSDLGNSFLEVQRFLQKGKAVLFSGTPCQIGGLLSFLKTKEVSSSGLYTIDIVCHGTPSNSVWRNYLEHLRRKEGAEVIEFSFRYKPLGWKGYPIYAKFSNGVIKKNTIDVASYQNIYRKNLLMARACFSCKYPGNFESDITICDFWGVELLVPQIEIKGGVSLMVSRSIKGDALIKIMSAKEETSLVALKDESYQQYNHNLINQTERPQKYEQFWKDYNAKGMEYVLKKYGGESIKGRIVFSLKNKIRNTGILGAMKKWLKKA